MAAVASFASVTLAASSHPSLRYRITTSSESPHPFCGCFFTGCRDRSLSVNTGSRPSFHARFLCICKSSLEAAMAENSVNADLVLPADSDRSLSRASVGSVCGVGRGSSNQTELPYGLDARFLPSHVAIIMDGNSRWAKRRGLAPYAGHEAGVLALKEVVRLSCLWGIQALTVFAFSTENWLRPKVEVSFLIGLFEAVLKEELANLVKENIQVRLVGDIRQLPKSLQALVTEVESKTGQNTGLKLTVALGYSGRSDIVQACKRIAVKVQKGELKPEDVTESLVDNELGTSWMGDARNPDLLIRTSGEQRLSNFLLWQLAYTELFFLDAYWPEVDEALYAKALVSYQSRNRRFGRRSDSEVL